MPDESNTCWPTPAWLTGSPRRRSCTRRESTTGRPTAGAWWSCTTKCLRATLGALALTRVGPDPVLLAALALLMTLGVLPTDDAVTGFSSEAVLTIGVGC
jgi:hypothetical protein